MHDAHDDVCMCEDGSPPCPLVITLMECERNFIVGTTIEGEFLVPLSSGSIVYMQAFNWSTIKCEHEDSICVYV